MPSRNSTLSRRRSSGDEEEAKTERPTRRRSGGASEAEEKPTRSRKAESKSDDAEEDKPRRRRSTGGGSGGFSSYAQKRKSGSKFADEFKPSSGDPTLIKFLDAEPFDVYNQHWIEEVGAGNRKSYVCRDDEFFDDDDGCPLCDLGETSSTYSLFNVLDLTNPRKPEVKVWKTSVTVTDKLERLATNDKTSPLNREDIYFEVTMTKKKNKTEWDIQPVKARDLNEDFDIDPFDGEELDTFEKERFEDRTSVTQVDSFEDLETLADSLD